MTVTVKDLARYKSAGRRFIVLTAYDYSTARILDEAGVPVLLVGDSLAQVVLGHPTTLQAGMEEMLHHTKAVARGARSALIVADMPFGSYQASPADALRNAARFLSEGHAHAVKLEGPRPETVATLTEAGIPVMGHLGLTPQSVHAMGGYKVQARTEEGAARLLSDAMNLQKAGAFAVVLEGIPAGAAAAVTGALDAVTIGIGAGPHCDAQVLVTHDLLGLTPEPRPRFVKAYAALAAEITGAVQAFRSDVESGAFPGEEQSYS